MMLFIASEVPFLLEDIQTSVHVAILKFSSSCLSAFYSTSYRGKAEEENFSFSVFGATGLSNQQRSREVSDTPKENGASGALMSKQCLITL